MDCNKESLKIVTVIGDSLSMVRPWDDIIYTDTYIYKLQKYLGPTFHVLLRSRRMNDFGIINLEDDVLNNSSCVVVFHLGIVDCAPRVFGRREYSVLNFFSKYPVLKNFSSMIIRFKSRYRRYWTRFFPKTYIPKPLFKKKLEHVINQISQKTNSSVIMINIADTNEKNKFRSYNYENNIKDYNKIINDTVKNHEDICSLIDFYGITKIKENKETLLLSDGIHLSKKGHDLLAELIRQKIQELTER